MEGHYQLINEAVRNRPVQFSTGHVHFDEDGISEWVDAETMQLAVSIPGFAVFTTSEHTPGESLPTGTPQPVAENASTETQETQPEAPAEGAEAQAPVEEPAPEGAGEGAAETTPEEAGTDDATKRGANKRSGN